MIHNTTKRRLFSKKIFFKFKYFFIFFETVFSYHSGVEGFFSDLWNHVSKLKKNFKKIQEILICIMIKYLSNTHPLSAL